MKISEPWTYGSIAASRLEIWQDKPGNSVRKKHLRLAIDKLDGRVDLILCKAEDPEADPRKTVDARPWPERVGIIENADFDEETGVFLMRLVPRSAK